MTRNIHKLTKVALAGTVLFSMGIIDAMAVSPQAANGKGDSPRYWGYVKQDHVKDVDLTLEITNFISFQRDSEGYPLGRVKAMQIIQKAGPELEYYIKKFEQENPEYSHIKINKR